MFDIDMVIGFLCGVNGGIATVYVGQPLDTVKVKMQTFPEQHRSAWSCLRATLVKDGVWRGLYAGTVPALAANVAENAVLFCALPAFRRLVARGLDKPEPQLTPFQSGLAGAGAAVFSGLVLCPTELVKCRQQALRELIEAGRSQASITETGPATICKLVYRQEGLRGFFRGLVPTLAREVPGYFCFFMAYELSCYMFQRYRYTDKPPRSKAELTVWETGVGGALAGVTLWTAIFPFDLVKSRMQISTTLASEKPRSLLADLTHIAREEGVRALYKGLGPTVVRTIPATAALFIAVEYTKKLADHIRYPDL